MVINNLVIKVGTVVLFRKNNMEYVGQVDYIEQDRFLHGSWGKEILFPEEENFSILRSYDGKLTEAGQAYNKMHPGNTI
jgi:hypothetical protein